MTIQIQSQPGFMLVATPFAKFSSTSAAFCCKFCLFSAAFVRKHGRPRENCCLRRRLEPEMFMARGLCGAGGVQGLLERGAVPLLPECGLYAPLKEPIFPFSRLRIRMAWCLEIRIGAVYYQFAGSFQLPNQKQENNNNNHADGPRWHWDVSALLLQSRKSTSGTRSDTARGLAAGYFPQGYLAKCMSPGSICAQCLAGAAAL